MLEVPEPLVVDKNISSSLFAMEGLAISGHSGVKLVYVNVNATDLKVTHETFEILSTLETVRSIHNQRG